MTNTEKNVEILDKRKVLAEFMGVRYYNDEKVMKVFDNDYHDGIAYHCEWHPNCELSETNILVWDYCPDKSYCQLMPIWVKFRDLDNLNASDEHTYLRHCDNVSHSITRGTISEAFEALYEAILWFNNLNK